MQKERNIDGARKGDVEKQNGLEGLRERERGREREKREREIER